MNDTLQTLLLEWLISGLVLILVGVVWWGVRAYFRDMREREAAKQKAQDERDAKLENRDRELQNCIDGLKESIWGLRDLFVLRKDYDRDMEALRGNRRAGDRCPAEDCPFEGTDGGQRIELTGSGAKSLKGLIEAAQREKGALTVEPQRIP